jgi:hypothetical protein
MAGTGVMTKSDSTDLSKNFKDAERINLEYRVKSSSDEAVATAKVVMDKMLEVTAKGVGSATITVEALDGVNPPVEGTFGVTVVESNTAPTSTLFSQDEALPAALEPLLYISSGALKVTINSDARAGAASGIDDELIFDAKMGAAGTDDDIISFSVVPGSTVGTWDVTLTPLMSGKQRVRVAITDKFGSAVATVNRWTFTATVNTPPSLEKEAEDMTIVAAATATAFSLAEHFDVSVKASSLGPDPTSENDPTLETASTQGATDSPAVCSAATVPDQGAISISPGSFSLPNDNVGTYDLTVTCQDAESAVHTTAKITVRAAITS